jgi:precorrin-2 dehydrogenase/sirohydrochlorin ferrochelatase
MRYFPINLAIRDRLVVIVGGGTVAARKCAQLLDAGASITVIAPKLDVRLETMRDKGKISHLEREFTRGDLAGAFLAFAATGNPAVNRAVAEEGKDRGTLTTIADAPELCDFTMPALVQRGDLQIAVSTGGNSPALAHRIRGELELRYGPEYETALILLGNLREKLLTEKGNSAYNKGLFTKLVGHDLPALIRNRSTAEIDHLLTELFGPGKTLAELGVGEKDTE